MLLLLQTFFAEPNIVILAHAETFDQVFSRELLDAVHSKMSETTMPNFQAIADSTLCKGCHVVDPFWVVAANRYSPPFLLKTTKTNPSSFLIVQPELSKVMPYP